MTVIGRGIFTWDGIERQTDRYGSFALVSRDEDIATDTSGKTHVFSDFKAADASAYLDGESLAPFAGQYVTMTAKVIVARDSRHVGDRNRGIVPSTPDVGAVIEIGKGELFVVRSYWATGEACGDVFIGLAPDDGRPNVWLDPAILYRLHDQTVEISVEPAIAPAVKIPVKPETFDDVTLVMEPTGDGYMQIKRVF